MGLFILIALIIAVTLFEYMPFTYVVAGIVVFGLIVFCWKRFGKASDKDDGVEMGCLTTAMLALGIIFLLMVLAFTMKSCFA